MGPPIIQTLCPRVLSKRSLNSISSGPCTCPSGADPFYSSTVHLIQEVEQQISLPWVTCESPVLNLSTGVPRPQLQIPSTPFFHLLCAALFSHGPLLPIISQYFSKAFSSLIVCTCPGVTTIPIPVHALSSCPQICFCVSWLKVTGDSMGQTLEATSILRQFAHFPAFWSARFCWIGIFLLEGLDFWLRSLPFPLSFQPAAMTFCFKTLRNFQDQNMAGAESSRKLSCSNKAGLPGWKIFHRFFSSFC